MRSKDVLLEALRTFNTSAGAFAHMGISAVESVPSDYPERIKRIRARLGLTQTQLAELLGVSFATVNRWENQQSQPSQLAWPRIERLVAEDADQAVKEPVAPTGPPLLDFTGDPGVVGSVAAEERDRERVDSAHRPGSSGG